MKKVSGIKVLEEIVGEGPEAAKGDSVTYNIKIFLSRGEEVPFNREQAERLPDHLSHIIRNVDDYKFIDHNTTLGKREPIPAVEYSLYGMKAGGYKKIIASPHLAYREKGVPGYIPENAALTIELWLRSIN